MRVLPLSRYSSNDRLKIGTDNGHVLEIWKMGLWECALDRHALFPITSWPYKVKNFAFAQPLAMMLCSTLGLKPQSQLATDRDLQDHEPGDHRQRPP